GDIGRAIAVRLAKEGTTIALLYRSHTKDEADAFIAMLQGDGHVAFACDFGSPQEVIRIVEEAAKQLGGIEVCVHAAASPLAREKASVISLEKFKQQFEVTTFGGLGFLQACIPHLKENKKGTIVALTTAAIEPGASAVTMAGYRAAKSALRSVLHDLAHELKPFNINVYAVAPGFVPTAMHKDLPARAFDFILHEQPNQTFTTPEDVAEVVYDLVTDPSVPSGTSVPVGAGEPTLL
ncbi:MAG TPA: SDR family oxidoreductase, partial [Candidatus Paceibacterota bacterium]|nr:SDR family oxidoreductase [Candidatus Paceibacterota bacterium]